MKPIIDEYIKKFPSNFYFYTSKHMGKNDDDMQVNFIPTEVASYFAVLRDLAIRHWDVESNKEYFQGSINEPFDLQPYDIDPKTLILVCKLLSKEHQTVTQLTPEEIAKSDEIV